MPAEASDVAFTSGPITRTLVSFALPTLGSAILQSLNTSVNSIWIGRLLGERALAAVANANIAVMVLISLVFGLGFAASILIGHDIGRKDPAGVRQVMGSAFSLFTLGSLVLALLGWISSTRLLHLLATPPDALELAEAYFKTLMLALPGLFLVSLMSMTLRSVGDAKTPFLVMLLAVALDAALNPVLILGMFGLPALGISGSATATLIAEYCSLAVFIIVTYARDLPLRLRGSEFRWLLPKPDIGRRLFGMGIPIGMEMVASSIASLILLGLINKAGVDVVAALTLTLQLWAYVQMPAMALAGAASTIAAVNMGAGEWDRVTHVTRSAVGIALGISVLLCAMLVVFDKYLLHLFLAVDSPAVAIAERALLIATPAIIMFAVTVVLIGTVRSSGGVFAPLVILLIAQIPARLGAIWLLQPSLGADAFWYSLLVSAGTSLGLTLIYYQYGSWRSRARERLAVPLSPAVDAQAAGVPIIGLELSDAAYGPDQFRFDTDTKYRA